MNKYSECEEIAKVLLEDDRERVLIAVGGGPGSGKSYLSAKLEGLLPNSVVVPMDGYHKYRADLSEEQLAFRGRIDTFDLEKFENDVSSLISTKTGVFPSFSHSLKDPIQNEIKVSSTVKYVILEGLYIFSTSLSFDYSIWVESEIETVKKRLVDRFLSAKIEETPEKALKRAETNDLVNRKTVEEQVKERLFAFYVTN